MTDTESNWTRRQTLRNGLFAAGGLAFGGVALSGPVAAEEAQTGEFPFGLTVPRSENPCTEEDVPVSGTFHLVLQGDPSGDHFNFKITAHGEGVGVETGTEWRWNDTVQFTRNVNGAETITERFGPGGLGNIRFISRGPTDNLLVEGFLHTTVNANGEVTAMKVEPLEFVCRG